MLFDFPPENSCEKLKRINSATRLQGALWLQAADRRPSIFKLKSLTSHLSRASVFTQRGSDLWIPINQKQTPLRGSSLLNSQLHFVSGGTRTQDVSFLNIHVFFILIHTQRIQPGPTEYTHAAHCSVCGVRSRKSPKKHELL